MARDDTGQMRGLARRGDDDLEPVLPGVVGERRDLLRRAVRAGDVHLDLDAERAQRLDAALQRGPVALGTHDERSFGHEKAPPKTRNQT